MGTRLESILPSFLSMAKSSESKHALWTQGRKEMYVDFMGIQHPLIDPKTGYIIEYEVFVAVLKSSQYA